MYLSLTLPITAGQNGSGHPIDTTPLWLIPRSGSGGASRVNRRIPSPQHSLERRMQEEAMAKILALSAHPHKHPGMNTLANDAC